MRGFLSTIILALIGLLGAIALNSATGGSIAFEDGQITIYSGAISNESAGPASLEKPITDRLDITASPIPANAGTVAGVATSQTMETPRGRVVLQVQKSQISMLNPYHVFDGQIYYFVGPSIYDYYVSADKPCVAIGWLINDMFGEDLR